MSADVRAPVPTTFYREIDRNRRRSWLLVAAVIVVLGLLGGAIGYASGFGWGGVVMALLLGGDLAADGGFLRAEFVDGAGGYWWVFHGGSSK